MKKKLAVIILTVLLVGMFVPALSYGVTPAHSCVIAVGGGSGQDALLKPDGTGVTPDGSGLGWFYTQGVLTLDGFAGEYIDVMGSGSLTVILKNKNTVNGPMYSNGVNYVFTGSGSLEINRDVASGNGIYVAGLGAVLEFSLSPGGKVMVSGTADRGAIFVARPQEDSLASDLIILGEGNQITAPAGGALGIFDPWLLPAEEKSPGVPAQPKLPPDGDPTYASILNTDGSLAVQVTIENPLTAAEEPAVDPDPAADDPSPAEPITKASVKTPKTDDDSLAGPVFAMMIVGAAATAGLGKRKFD